MSSIYTAMRKEHLSTWRLWYLINQRCDPEWRAKYIPHNTTFYDICDDWSREVSGEQGFINFMDDVGDLSAVENLHRIDTNKAYEPNNVVKGTTTTRAHRTRSYLSPKAQGAQRAKLNGIPPWEYYGRLKKGWSIKRASTEPYKSRYRRKNNGIT